MRIDFEDKSHVTCQKSDNSNKILLTISATDFNNKLKQINNSVELTLEEFKYLISDIL